MGRAFGIAYSHLSSKRERLSRMKEPRHCLGSTAGEASSALFREWLPSFDAHAISGRNSVAEVVGILLDNRVKYSIK